jgi:predicted NUDIX family NTP pyrophosphohydrolase
LIDDDVDATRLQCGAEVGVIIRKPCTQFAHCANVGWKVDQAFAFTGDVAQTSKEEQSCHPPVTDMWRAVAGARSRSM